MRSRLAARRRGLQRPTLSSWTCFRAPPKSLRWIGPMSPASLELRSSTIASSSVCTPSLKGGSCHFSVICIVRSPVPGSSHFPLALLTRQPLTSPTLWVLWSRVTPPCRWLRILWPHIFHLLWLLLGSSAPSFLPSHVGPLPPLSGSPTSRPVRQVWSFTQWPSFRPTRWEPPSGGAQATRLPPTTVWGARGRSSSRQQPRKRVNMKRPNKPAASANPGRSWRPGRNEESRFTVTGRGQTAKVFLPAPNALSSLKSVTTTLRGLVCRSNSPSFSLGLAVGGRVRLSPFAARPLAAGELHVRWHSCFSPAVYGTHAGHPSAQHFSLRHPEQGRRGLSFTVEGAAASRLSRHPISGMSSLADTLIPLSHFLHEWERLPGVSLWVLRTIRTGYTLQLGRNPPRFDGVHLTVVNSASKASVLQQELSSLLQKGAIEEVPQSEVEQGFFSRYFLVPKRDGGLRPILDLRRLNLSSTKGSSRCWRWGLSCLRSRRETGLSPSTWRMRIFTSRSFKDTGDSFGLPLEGRLTNTRSCPSAWLWTRGHLPNAWMLHWPLWGSRASVYYCWFACRSSGNHSQCQSPRY